MLTGRGLERGFRGCTSKWWRWCSVLLLKTRKSLGVPIVLVLCGDARTNLRVLRRASIDGGAWKSVPLLICKRGGRSLSEGHYQEQAEGAYHAIFSLSHKTAHGVTRPHACPVFALSGVVHTLTLSAARAPAICGIYSRSSKCHNVNRGVSETDNECFSYATDGLWYFTDCAVAHTSQIVVLSPARCQRSNLPLIIVHGLCESRPG